MSMNVLVFIAGILALFATLGHFTMGRKLYMKPLMQSDVDPLLKGIFRALFHYSSAFLLLSTFFLIMIGVRGSNCMFDPFIFLAFTGGTYVLMGLWQIVVALQSGLEKPLAKLFQWVFWLIIGGLIIASLALNCGANG